jgi:hypothetical protein
VRHSPEDGSQRVPVGQCASDVHFTHLPNATSQKGSSPLPAQSASLTHSMHSARAEQIRLSERGHVPPGEHSTHALVVRSHVPTEHGRVVLQRSTHRLRESEQRFSDSQSASERHSTQRAASQCLLSPEPEDVQSASLRHSTQAPLATSQRNVRSTQSVSIVHAPYDPFAPEGPSAAGPSLEASAPVVVVAS